MFSKIISSTLLALSYLIHSLPRPIRKGLGIAIGLIWFDVLRIRRSTAIANVKRAFPKISHGEAVKMARTSLIHMGYNVVELFSMPFLSKKQVLDQFEFRDMDKIEKALEKGKGVFMISVHVANGD